MEYIIYVLMLKSVQRTPHKKSDEKCKSVLDNRGFAGAIMMDLSKAFDCLHHDLLITKLHAYSFNRTALKHIHSYLSGRQQRVKNKRLIQHSEMLLLGRSPKFCIGAPLIQYLY